jgi:AcrR family transcriptional regulator
MYKFDRKLVKKKSYHHGDLRHSLLAAAESLLARKGVAELSLREVAKAAGVSHAAPYRHFRDKRDLIEALAAEGFRYLTRASREIEHKYPSQPERQLIELGWKHFYLALEKPAIVHLLFGDVLSLKNAGKELREAAQEAIESLVRMVKNGQKVGLYKKTNAHILALAAISMVHGFSLLVISGRIPPPLSGRLSIKFLGKALADVLLHGMLKRHEKTK